MKRLWTLALALSLAAAAFGQSQPAPVIGSIAPSSGPTAGAIDVTITGSNLQPHIECIVPCPTTVAFGNVQVEPYRVTDTEITVKAPAHAAGTVDVTVTVPGGGSATAPQAFTFSAAATADWEPVLIPVYIDQTAPGANNSLWRTNLWIQNGGNQSLAIAPWVCVLPPGVCVTTFPTATLLTPGQSLHNLVSAIYGNFTVPGRIIYLNRAAADSAFLNLRVVDDASIAVDSGTEVPVVRERNLLTNATTLINVPLLNTRLLLRVYDVALTNAQFHLRVFMQSETVSDTPLAEATLTAVSADSGDFHVTPAYAEYAVNINFGPVLLAKDAAVRVEVTPLSAGSRYWAFVSATNNTTNHVTLVTPQ